MGKIAFKQNNKNWWNRGENEPFSKFHDQFNPNRDCVKLLFVQHLSLSLPELGESKSMKLCS